MPDGAVARRLARSPVAGGLEAQHGGGHRHVEALGPTARVDAHPLVDRRVVGRGRGPRCRRRGRSGRSSRRRCAPRRGARRCRAVAARPRRRRRASAGTTGTWNSAPADARTTFGLNGSTEPGVSTTASAPAASAERMIVPRLPGSARRSATTTKSAAPSGSVGDRRLGDDGEQRLAASRWTRPARPRRRQLEHRAGTGDRRARRGPTRLTPRSTQPAATASAISDRALDDERALVGTRTAAPEQAPQSLDLWVGERQRGAR